MNLIKNDDPLLLENYLLTRISELKKLSIVAENNLLPAKIYQSDKSCSYLKLTNASDITQYEIILDDFAIIESSVSFPESDPYRIPSIAFKAGDYSESILFIDGKEITGIATGQWDDGESIFLNNVPAGEHKISIHMETDTSYGGVRPKERTLMEYFSYQLVDKRIYDIYMQLSILTELYSSISQREVAKYTIRENLIKLYALINIEDYRQIIENYSQITKFIEENFYNKNNNHPVSIHMLGHAHIDIAWLWDIDKTKRKVIRTFLNQIHLIEKYPDMIFQQGQPWIYKYLKKEHPELYTKILHYVKKGNIEPAGGIWVESDMNIIGFESLIRQILLGKKFIKKEFNIDCKVLWVPDVFGFSGALPQILKKSGLDTMITTKISWNQYTKFPHHTFNWSSPDGSKIVCHFVTLPDKENRFHTYNGKANLPEIYKSWDEYRGKAINQDLLIPYGYGDGGAGPKERMLDKIDIYQKKLPGFYNFKHTGIEEYRKILLKNIADKTLPTWHKDLYLQLHRGTYSSQSNTKKYNALLEHLLKTYEKLLVIYRQQDEQLQDIWEEYLVQQFHDILPGTAINKVYKDAQKFYKALESLLHEKIKALYAKTIPKNVPKTVPKTDKAIIFNPHSQKYSGAVNFNDSFYVLENIPPCSIHSTTLNPLVFEVSNTELLENEFLTININKSTGSISSLYDKELDIEYSLDELNTLQTYEDRPITPNKSAWLLEAYHTCKPLQKGLLVNEISYYRASGCSKCTLKGKIHNSEASLDILLFSGSRMVYFDMHIDWQEQNKVLKVENSLNLVTNHVTYASQGSVITKPNYFDTLEEQAQFENPAQRWADMSETSHGITLMSDYKYSFSANENKLSMILLRSPISPDQSADQGSHSIRYALYPHLKGWAEADVPNRAKSFHEPPLITNAQAIETLPFYTITDKNPMKEALIIETIKYAEDGNGIILRAYESKGSSGTVKIKFNTMKLQRGYLCNLLEENECCLEIDENSVSVSYKPFEILSLKLVEQQD
jgi:alpha-mannosidase